MHTTSYAPLNARERRSENCERKISIIFSQISYIRQLTYCPISYRNKCYACFDGDNDIHWYRMMTAWHANDAIDFNYFDAHSLTQARDSSSEETIKKSLRERLNNSREFIVLVGDKTKNLHRFVRWEIEVAIKLDIPIIVVNLNKLKTVNWELCPPILKEELAIHIPFGQKIIEYALKNWPDMHKSLKADGVKGPRIYLQSVYDNLGI